MPNDAGTVIGIQPGVDDTKHDQNLHQGIAATLSDAVGTQVTPAQVAPPASQQPGIPDALPEGSRTEFDFGEFVKSETGQSPVKTEPARGWLGVLLGKLRKKNPGTVLEPEKK